MLKDQERTGPNRIPRDYPTIAVVRTKMHFSMFLAAGFIAAGIITFLQPALDDRGHLAGVACLLAAVVCAAVSAMLDGQITTMVIIARQIGDLDSRFRAAEERMLERMSRIDRKETRMLHEMTGLQGVLGEVVEDELDQRRRN